MTTPEEKYYDSMNTLLAPVRWVKSMIQAALFILLLTVIGLAYPVIVYFNHEPVTFATIMVPILTLTAIFTLFYATTYLICGGMLFLVGWGAQMIISGGAPDRTQTLWVWTAFFTVGILQSYIRRRIKASHEPPQPKQLGFCAQLNQVRLERLTRKYDALSPADRETLIKFHGDNYLTWPEPW